MFVCHQDDVYGDAISSVYVGGCCSMSGRGLYVFGKLCPVGFLVFCECSLLQSIVMSYVDCGDDGWVVWSDDSTC